MSERTDANKAIVQRLIDNVLNGGNLDLIDQLCTSELAPAPAHGSPPFRDAQMR